MCNKMHTISWWDQCSWPLAKCSTRAEYGSQSRRMTWVTQCGISEGKHGEVAGDYWMLWLFLFADTCFVYD